MFVISGIRVNSHTAELIYLNFQPLEVVSRYRDPQPQVVENSTYLFSWRSNILQILMIRHSFIPNNSDLIGQ